jgi:anti-sigma factor RsiW
MKGCEEVRGLVFEAVDGTISADRRERLDAHVATCDACRSALADQSLVREALSSLPLATVSAGFAARVRAAVEPAPSWLNVTNWRDWTLRLAPAAALLCLLAWWPGQREEGSGQSLSAQLQSFATAGASETQLLLVDADADADRLLSAALGETSR